MTLNELKRKHGWWDSTVVDDQGFTRFSSPPPKAVVALVQESLVPGARIYMDRDAKDVPTYRVVIADRVIKHKDPDTFVQLVLRGAPPNAVR